MREVVRLAVADLVGVGEAQLLQAVVVVGQVRPVPHQPVNPAERAEPSLNWMMQC